MRALTYGLLLVPLWPADAIAQSAQKQQPTSMQTPTWAQMPRMQLERQFAGPLQDTVVQRWRDPADGTVCYIYLPITAPHSVPTPSGYVQYGANTIGAISCLREAPATSAPARRAKSLPPPLPVAPDAAKEPAR